MGDFEQKNLQVHMHKKKFLHKTIVPNKFMHVQRAEKKFWQDVL